MGLGAGPGKPERQCCRFLGFEDTPPTPRFDASELGCTPRVRFRVQRLCWAKPGATAGSASPSPCGVKRHPPMRTGHQRGSRGQRHEPALSPRGGSPPAPCLMRSEGKGSPQQGGLASALWDWGWRSGCWPPASQGGNRRTPRLFGGASTYPTAPECCPRAPRSGSLATWLGTRRPRGRAVTVGFAAAEERRTVPPGGSRCLPRIPMLNINPQCAGAGKQLREVVGVWWGHAAGAL